MGYQVGVPAGGFWREILNSDAKEYGGSGVGNLGGVEAAKEAMHGRPYSLTLTFAAAGGCVSASGPDYFKRRGKHERRERHPSQRLP